MLTNLSLPGIVGNAEYIAGIIVFYAQNEAKWIDGQRIAIRRGIISNKKRPVDTGVLL